ncbi:MAG: hypothetical protein GXP03_14185 [Alphaproteobacteria bacterium]|nr:hypothetical protein [Alphaproteobacteria bacterium]
MTKRKMPEEGRFETRGVDRATGANWVYVTRSMAHNHPQGRLNLALYAIILWFLISAGTKIYLIVGFGFSPWGGLVAILPFFTALLLFMRAPVSIALTIVQLAIGVPMALQKSSYQYANLQYIELALLAIAVVYLLEGDRPNLIYRLRYRSYKNVAEPDV